MVPYLHILLCNQIEWIHRKANLYHRQLWAYISLYFISSNCKCAKLPLEYSQLYQNCNHCCLYMVCGDLFPEWKCLSREMLVKCLIGRTVNNFIWIYKKKIILFVFLQCFFGELLVFSNKFFCSKGSFPSTFHQSVQCLKLVVKYQTEDTPSRSNYCRLLWLDSQCLSSGRTQMHH